MSKMFGDQPTEKNGFSLEPELLGTGPKGELKVIDADYYVYLSNASIGRIYYTLKSNKYWGGENAEMAKDVFEKKYLPYLRWKYDEMVEEKVETERDGKKVMLPTGRKISLFPPTPENIQKKRDEIIAAELAAKKQPDLNKIWADTAPRRLLETEAFMEGVDDRPFLQKLASKLYRV